MDKGVVALPWPAKTTAGRLSKSPRILRKLRCSNEMRGFCALRHAIIAAIFTLTYCIATAAEAADEDCDAVRMLAPGSALAAIYWARGECAGENGDVARQVAYYRLSLHQNPVSIQWLYNNHATFQLLTFTAALAANGDATEAHWWWASIDEFFHQLDPKRFPSSGDRLFDARKYPRAFDAFYRSLYVAKGNPDYSGYPGAGSGPGDGALQLGLQRAAKGDYAGAIVEWNAANAQNSTFNKPTFPEPTFYVGCAEFALGHRASAIQSWTKVLTISTPAPVPFYFSVRQIEAVHFLARDTGD